MEDAYVLQLSDRKFSDLYLCYCGYAKCEPLHSFGPAVRSNYLIHYILEGKGHYRAGGKRYNLQAGQGFLIEPGTKIFYEADEEDPWTYLWVGFHGRRAEEYLRDAGLGDGRLIFCSERGEELKKLVVRMLKNYTITATDQFLLEGSLYLFLSILAEDTARSPAQEHGVDNMYIKKALGYIQDNYGHSIRVADIAEYVCINRSYLYTLFKNAMGMSPQQFLSTFRITRAAELLEMTSLPVESIALSCGYSDPLVFTKSFKQMRHMSPSAYRKQIQRGEIRKNKEYLSQIEEFINQADKINS